jgi:hypothetical protein
MLPSGQEKFDVGCYSSQRAITASRQGPAGRQPQK